jgi:hypothetical protein
MKKIPHKSVSKKLRKTVSHESRHLVRERLANSLKRETGKLAEFDEPLVFLARAKDYSLASYLSFHWHLYT